MASPHLAIDYRHEQPQARLASGVQHGCLQLRRRMAAIAPQISEFNVDMKRLLRSIQPTAIAFGLLTANALLAVATPGTTRQEGVQSLRVEKLSNAPGTSPDSLESNQTKESYAIRKIRSREPR